ncbi:MAG TPA: C39 family peptidase [Anaerolineales bacterium]|jgi:tetratricopeptide (TPR) repeat protein
MFKIPRPFRIPLVIIGIVVLAAVVYNIPFVNDRLSWRLDNVRTQINYFFNPPDQAVFVPEQQAQIDQIVTATLLAMRTPTLTPSPQATTTPGGPTAAPTLTPTTLPEAVSIPGVIYVDQWNRWNYCGPANLSMALNFWGWKGNRDDIAKVVKPGINDPKLDFIQRGKPDKNVMPYEMVDFVNDNTQFRALQRFGGDIDLLKRFIASGYPVLIEKGYYERDYAGNITWMGHYLFVTGYDDSQGGFIVQDAYLKPGKNLISKYDIFQEGWRSFNYLFMLIYPADRESQIYALLGDWGDPKWANQNALTIANTEIKTQTGIDSFFAWFNKGTSHVQQLEYADAASAYDQAFSIYATLGKDEKQRPYRIMWYQTWPYRAYYYTGRYHDVVDLANTTLLKTIDKPTLEESLYWRGLGELALGQTGAAVQDLQSAYYYNPHFDAAITKLKEIGAPLTP